MKTDASRIVPPTGSTEQSSARINAIGVRLILFMYPMLRLMIKKRRNATVNLMTGFTYTSFFP